MARGRWLGAAAAVVAFGVAAGPERTARATAGRPPLAVRIAATGCTAVASRGGGVAIGGALVATVAHVVAGSSGIRVTTPDGRELPARIVAIDTEGDVALLAVDGLSAPSVRTVELAEGDDGTYPGHGAGRPAAVAFTVTQAASIVGEDIYVKGRHGRPGYVLAAPVVHGDSGAGLVRNDGALGGLVWAASRNDDRQGWGIGVDALAPLIAATAPGAGEAPAVPCPLP